MDAKTADETREKKDVESGSRSRLSLAEERLVIAVVAAIFDLLCGEPPAAIHPVNWIGAAITTLERSAPRPGPRRSLRYGIASSIALGGLTLSVAGLINRLLRPLPAPLRILLEVSLLKPAFALRCLLASGRDVETALSNTDLPSARTALASLVSRATEKLSAAECAAAAVESLAENTADSVIGPWLAYALLGLPGAWLFRTINTMDSRWGYHGRYEWLGRSAAKLDDLAAFVPARISAILLIAAMPFASGRPGAALRALLADRTRTESPNAGWTMSAMAGGLGCRLEKPGSYLLNGGAPDCRPDDIRRARQVVRTASWLALTVAAVGLATWRLARGARGSGTTRTRAPEGRTCRSMAASRSETSPART